MLGQNGRNNSNHINSFSTTHHFVNHFHTFSVLHPLSDLIQYYLECFFVVPHFSVSNVQVVEGSNKLCRWCCMNLAVFSSTSWGFLYFWKCQNSWQWTLVLRTCKIFSHKDGQCCELPNKRTGVQNSISQCLKATLGLWKMVSILQVILMLHCWYDTWMENVNWLLLLLQQQCVENAFKTQGWRVFCSPRRQHADKRSCCFIDCVRMVLVAGE